MKKILLIACVLFVYCGDNRSTPASDKPLKESPAPELLLQTAFLRKVDSLLPMAKAFTKTNEYNEEYVFIADLSMHSGMERFVVVDLAKDSVVHKGLVAHGAGGNYFSEKARYSNVPNSLCSSPGKYKIGTRYNGNFGRSYKLHGLDKTNSKAFERYIVLHAYDCVPDERPYPEYLCNSEGCPMVSYQFLDVLSSYIDNSKKPVLLWIVG